MFPLTTDDRSQLQRLNDNKPLVFALKKLFLNASMKGNLPTDVNVLAAERIALDIVKDAFHQLNAIQQDTTNNKQMGNMV